MQLLRHGDERTNDRYGKSVHPFASAPVRHTSMRAIWWRESRLTRQAKKVDQNLDQTRGWLSQ